MAALKAVDEETGANNLEAVATRTSPQPRHTRPCAHIDVASSLLRAAWRGRRVRLMSHFWLKQSNRHRALAESRSGSHACTGDPRKAHGGARALTRGRVSVLGDTYTGARSAWRWSGGASPAAGPGA